MECAEVGLATPTVLWLKSMRGGAEGKGRYRGGRRQILREVGLEDRMDHFPAQLSGGEQQRVAIARALVKNPDLILCDEPTGALDHQTGKAVLALLWKINQEKGKTVVIVTYNSAIAAMGHLFLTDGRKVLVRLTAYPLPVEGQVNRLKLVSGLMPDPENFGVVMMPLGQVQTVLGQPGVINQILVRLAPGADGEEVSDGKVRRRAVEIGMVGEIGVEIVSGLVEGEEVVRDGSLDLQENAISRLSLEM